MQKKRVFQILFFTLILGISFLYVFPITAHKLTPEQKMKIEKTKEELLGIPTLKNKTDKELELLVEKHSHSGAFILLAKRKSINIDRMVEILSAGIMKEIVNPSKDNKIPESSNPTPSTDITKMGWAENVVYLGKEAIPYLKKQIKGKEEDDEFTQWITIALGYLGDKEVANSLIDLAMEAKNPNVRIESLRVLNNNEGELLRANMIPKLKNLLKDQYCIEINSDIKYQEKWRNFQCPIRGNAAVALEYLGLKIRKYYKDTIEYKVVE